MFHRDIYDEHHRSRSLEREDSDTRGRKTQKKKARGSDDSSANGGAADQPRSRSLSPLSNDDGVDARHQHEMKDSPLTRTRSLLIDRQSLSHLESPTRLSLSANRRSLNQRSTHRLENVLANLRRSREDAENETDQRPASSASSSNKRVDTRRSHKKGANKLQAAVTNSANISLSQTPTPKRGAGRPRKVIPAPSDEATASSVSNASDSVIANGSKTTPTDDMKPPAPSKSVNGPVATMRGTSGSSKMDSSDSKQSPTKTSNSRAQENNNKDSSSSSVVKKERSVSRESHKEREDGVKSATGTDAGDGSRVERSRRPKRQREQRPTLESEQPTSSSSSDDDDDEDDEKHTNTSGADSGTNGKSPGQDEGSSEIAPVVAALPSRRRSRTRAAAAEQQKSTDADHTNESDDSVEKSTPPTKATTSKRKAPPMPESSDSSGESEG
uniref:Uncharacterized protein n=1 Tax=Plectus sambesii TaxID=2011161 RepID=A0A914USF3_9BILA